MAFAERTGWWKLGRPILILLAAVVSLTGVCAPATTIYAQVSTPDAGVNAVPTASARFSLIPSGEYEGVFFDNLEIPGGESRDLEIEVRNFGENPVSTRLFRANASSAENGGLLAGHENDHPVGATAWIDFEPQEVNLAPNTAQTIAFTVQVPEDALPGQYVSTIIGATVDTMPIPGSDTIDHRIRYALPVSILVPGKLSFDFELGSPMMDGSWLTIPIDNTGNYRVRPEGTLEMRDSKGDVVLSTQVAMQSVFGGDSTTITFRTTVDMPTDEYTLSLNLQEPDSGAQAQLKDVPVTFVSDTEVADEPEFTLGNHRVTPNAEDIAFANVEVTIVNTSGDLPSTAVELYVLRNGVPLENFVLANNQVLLTGENTYQARYIPADTWESGTYTFFIILFAVDPYGSQRIELLNEPLESEIIVP